MDIQKVYTDGTSIVFQNVKDFDEYFKARARFEELFGDVVFVYNRGREDEYVSTQYKYNVRRVKDKYDYYELVCTDPDPRVRNARITYGHYENGDGLFPKHGRRPVKWDAEREKEVWLDVFYTGYGPSDNDEVKTTQAPAAADKKRSKEAAPF